MTTKPLTVPSVTTPPTLLQRVRDAKRDAFREAKACYPWVWSRGTWVATLDAQDRQCDPYPGADPLAWDGTMAQLERVIADIEANHPHVATITIEGGYDGGERATDKRDACYEPWVASWQVEAWTRRGHWSSVTRLILPTRARRVYRNPGKQGGRTEP